MIRVLPAVNAPVSVAVDGFGRRTNGIDAESGDEVEFLDLAPQLVEHAGFVAALAERVARLAAVRHMSYVRLQRLDRPAADRLQLVSDFTPGWRLSELLERSHALNTPLDITIVIGLLRQLLPAAALYGRNNRDAAIGTIGIERLIVTPQARLVIAELAFGPAIEKLNLGRDRLWRDYRVAMPPSAGLPRANQRADANGIGTVALSLILGRPLALDEFPSGLQPLIEGAKEYRDGGEVPLSSFFASWLARALQFDVRNAYQSPAEAQLAFESVLASDKSYVTTTKKLEEWVTRVGGMIDADRKGAAPSQSNESVALHVDHQYAGQPSSADAPGRGPASSADVPSASASELPVTAPIRKAPLLGMGAVIVALLVLVGWLLTRDTGAPRSGEGELVVQSRPQGATVLVDGKPRGTTPATLRLSSGAHVLEVKMGNSEPRVIPLMIRAGVQTAQYVELQEPQPISPPPPPPEKKRKR